MSSRAALPPGDTDVFGTCIMVENSQADRMRQSASDATIARETGSKTTRGSSVPS